MIQIEKRQAAKQEIVEGSAKKSHLFSLSSRQILLGMLAVVLSSVAIETCSGQILFRRRRERLKAEMKWELQQQLNENLDSQVESARGDLSKAATDQIQQEAAALRQSLKSEIAAMRAEADKIVAEEKQRIAKHAATQIAQIRSATKKQVEDVKKELNASTMNSLAKAENQLKSALRNYSKALENQNVNNVAKLEEKTTKKFDDLKGEMVELINQDVSEQVQVAIKKQSAANKKQIAANNKKMENRIKNMIEKALAKNSNSPQSPGDKKKPAKKDKKAILNRTPRITDEVSEEGDA